MGIRVDKEALLRQLTLSGQEKRKELYFHKRLLNETLPLCIGGGIGQSRLCMLYLQKAHIGEIQASIWPEDMRKECANWVCNLFDYNLSAMKEEDDYKKSSSFYLSFLQITPIFNAHFIIKEMP